MRHSLKTGRFSARGPVLLIGALLSTGCSDLLGPSGPLLAVAGDGASLPAGCVVDVAVELQGEASTSPVTFQVASGGGAVDAPEATPDGDGVARTRWTLGAGENQLTATSTSAPGDPLTLTAEGVPTAPGGYATIGNQIFSSRTCFPHRFVGVSRPGLEWNSRSPRLVVPELAEQDFRAIQSWNANVVRIPVSQSYWVTTSQHHDPEYAPMVERLVQQARAIGLDVIIDLHTSDRGDPTYAGEFELQQMPDVAHSVPFWTDVANRFKNDGGVIFEIFNEPNAVTWNVWRNGGDIPGGAQYDDDINSHFKKPYRAIGMQGLYDVVRSTGAQNLVIVAGTHWGFYLDELPQYELDGYNIAYASHPYDYPDKQPDSWDEAFGDLAAKYPVMITEFGVKTCNPTFLRNVLDYADEKRLSWMGWAWWNPEGPDREADMCEFPALISSWDGTPSSLGAVVQERLLSYLP